MYIYEDYSKYKKETKDASDDVKALKSTLDDADTILAQYKTALQKLKKSEYLASGGNPMMMDPFGMSMGMVDTRMMEAMQDELNNFKRDKGWTLVKRPSEFQNVIGTKWIFKKSIYISFTRLNVYSAIFKCI